MFLKNCASDEFNVNFLKTFRSPDNAPPDMDYINMHPLYDCQCKTSTSVIKVHIKVIYGDFSES